VIDDLGSMTDNVDGSGEIDWNAAKDAAIAAACTAGEILRSMLNRAAVREKGSNDLVTDADLAAQHAIESILLERFPDHAFLGEESTSDAADTSKAWQWVVDPLDGTTNYAHGLRGFCVSIALMHRRKPVLGVILDPMAQEAFYAISGLGAYWDETPFGKLNVRKIQPASCSGLGKALVAVSFPPRLSRGSLEIQRFLEVLLHAQSVRRLGSAALNLCYVACGRLDAYFGANLRVWDIAAAAVIAEEAGVRLARFDGSRFDSWHGEIAAAGNQSLLKELLEKMQVHP
jgi:myo-inositol-1(or 4)-monophosphatase